MKRPENVLETKGYIEPNSFENEQESILFFSYIEQEKYVEYLEHKNKELIEALKQSVNVIEQWQENYPFW
jgi:hypothetical protein